MKRQYIKPESEKVQCTLMNMIAASGNGTTWHEGDDPDPIGPDQPDPNADDANVYGLWQVDFEQN